MSYRGNLSLFGAALLLVHGSACWAHFQMIIPSDDILQQSEPRQIDLDVRFWHPFEGGGMNMATPVRFGVVSNGVTKDLRDTLKPYPIKTGAGDTFEGFKSRYTIQKPGDHVFFIEPQPYWEPAEESFIVHYTKVVVHAFGLEQGWDAEIGLKTEIIPLTRPYGLWAGNVFQGIVKVNGKTAPFSDVEIEFLNASGHAKDQVKAPADPMITQQIRSDSNGVFTYALPWEGWWGFAALHDDDKKMKKDGREYPVEMGALIWVRAYPKP